MQAYLVPEPWKQNPGVKVDWQLNYHSYSNGGGGELFSVDVDLGKMLVVDQQGPKS